MHLFVCFGSFYYLNRSLRSFFLVLYSSIKDVTSLKKIKQISAATKIRCWNLQLSTMGTVVADMCVFSIASGLNSLGILVDPKRCANDGIHMELWVHRRSQLLVTLCWSGKWNLASRVSFPVSTWVSFLSFVDVEVIYYFR